MSRILVWFSCGAASAVAAKVVSESVGWRGFEAVYCNLGADEHPDNRRFMRDVSRWIGRPITVIQGKYPTTDALFAKRRYMSGPAGAICTVEMKKSPRQKFQKPDDTHVFGMTSDEGGRVAKMERDNPELRLWWPLVELGITKEMCLSRIRSTGIALPAMYGLGFSHNNCIGCVKATSPKYWNTVRKHFPAAFERRAKQSRKIGCRLVRLNGERIFLDELPDDAQEDLFENLSCGPECGSGVRPAGEGGSES